MCPSREPEMVIPIGGPARNKIVNHVVEQSVVIHVIHVVAFHRRIRHLCIFIAHPAFSTPNQSRFSCGRNARYVEFYVPVSFGSRTRSSRMPVHKTRQQMPILHQGILEVFRHCTSAVHSCQTDGFDPNVISEHIAYRVEVHYSSPVRELAY